MDSNTHSTRPPTGHPARHPAGPPDGLAALAADLEDLAAQGLDGLPDAVRAERVLVLRRLLDRLEGHWLAELATVDACGAAGAEHGVQVGSTASWLRQRLRMSAGAATSSINTARALFRGPLGGTAKALTEGEVSVAHAAVLAHGTHDLPTQVAVEAEPVLVEAARRLDPARLRQVITHLRLVADPDAAARQTERRHHQRGLWVTSTLDNMVAIDGLLEPEAGQILITALEPLARPHSAQDARSGGQRRADALAELARRALEGGRLPQTGGVRPQLTVMVDLDSLQGRQGGLGGDTDLGALAPEACRRLACDGAVTRVLVTRHRHHDHQQDRSDHHGLGGSQGQDGSHHHGHGHGGDTALAAQLRTAAALLPRSWAGPRPSRWTSEGAAGSSHPPNASPWPCATVAVSSPPVTAPWPGAKLIIWSTGWMAARPTWPTWSCCAGPSSGGP